MVINPCSIPLRDINGLDCPSCFIGEETNQGKEWSAAHHLVIFPLSLPASAYASPGKRDVANTFTISTLLGGLLPNNLPTAFQGLQSQPAPAQPTSQTSWLHPPLCPAPESSFLSFQRAEVVPITQAPAPRSLSCFSSNAKPSPLHCPQGHLIILPPVFSSFLHSQHCSPKHLF